MIHGIIRCTACSLHGKITSLNDYIAVDRDCTVRIAEKVHLPGVGGNHFEIPANSVSAETENRVTCLVGAIPLDVVEVLIGAAGEGGRTPDTGDTEKRSVAPRCCRNRAAVLRMFIRPSVCNVEHSSAVNN